MSMRPASTSRVPVALRSAERIASVESELGRTVRRRLTSRRYSPSMTAKSAPPPPDLSVYFGNVVLLHRGRRRRRSRSGRGSGVAPTPFREDGRNRRSLRKTHAPRGAQGVEDDADSARMWIRRGRSPHTRAGDGGGLGYKVRRDARAGDSRATVSRHGGAGKLDCVWSSPRGVYECGGSRPRRDPRSTSRLAE